MSLLKENREAVEQELNVRSAVAVQNAEDAAQRRAEANTFRFVSDYVQIAPVSDKSMQMIMYWILIF